MKHGFNVTQIYADNFPADEKDAFDRIISDGRYDNIKVYPTNDPAMRFAAMGTVQSTEDNDQILAIGH